VFKGLIYFYLLVKRLSVILLILKLSFPYSGAHIQIASDLLFVPWCHKDMLVFQLF